MKILQTLKFSAPSKGGTESFIENLANTLIHKNVSIEIYSCNERPSFKNITNVKGRVTTFKQATFLFFKSQPLNILFSSLRRKIKSADVVHHNYPFPTLELKLLLNKRLLKNKRFIITWHANIKNSRWYMIEKYYDSMINRLLVYCDYIVVTSPSIYNASPILKNYKDKIKVIPLCCDPIFYQGSLPKKFPIHRSFKLLFVGKMRHYKGIHYLLEAISGLNLHLTLVGQNVNNFDYDHLIKENGLENNVTFLNVVSDLELVNIYKSHDLFILPSINESEAFGIVQIEAMASGLPVINTQIDSGVPYVSLNKFTGLTVPPMSSEEIRNAISLIMNDKEMYESFSINCIERSKDFDITKLSNSYYELFN